MDSDFEGLTPCPGCGDKREFGRRLCEKCLLANSQVFEVDAETVILDGEAGRGRRRVSIKGLALAALVVIVGVVWYTLTVRELVTTTW